MALTKNGKFTGYAAVVAKRELLHELMDQTDHAIMKNKDDFGELMSELRRLDPTGWSVWYDENVPEWNDWMKCETAVDVIRKRIAELKSV